MERPCNAVVIHSPHAGRSGRFAQALALLQEAGVQLAQVISIAQLDALPAQGAQWQAQGIDLAVAAGGDGLVGGVINHVAESGLPLGILPLGTSNDIARSLHLPLSLANSARVIATGRIQEMDIGLARPAEQAPLQDKPGPGRKRLASRKQGFFAHALTIGLNVQFARLATSMVTRQRYGRMTYPFAALEALRNHETLEVALHFQGLSMPQPPTFARQFPTQVLTEEELQKPFCLPALQVAVINAPIFGGAWQLAIPGASINDRLLDIVVIEDVGLDRLRAAFSQLFGLPEQHNQWSEQFTLHHPAELTGIPGIHHLQAQGITITTKTDPQAATLDGEVRGQTPMHVCLASERLRVVVPR